MFSPPPPTPPQPGASTFNPIIASGEIRSGVGGSRLRGVARPITPNTDPNAQTDPALRALNAQLPAQGPREEVYCTKIGSSRPDEMCIVGAHLDGRGFGEGGDVHGSGPEPAPMRVRMSMVAH